MKHFSLILIVVLLTSIFTVSAQDSGSHSLITVANAAQLEQIAAMGAGDITAASFSLDGAILAGGDMDGSIWLWDSIAGSEILSLEGHSGEVISLAFSPDGSLLASGGSDATVKVWDVAAGTERQALDNPAVAVTQGQSEFICDLAFSPDGSQLAVGTCESSGDDINQIVRVWNASSWEILGTLAGGTADIEFGPDGTLFTVKGNQILQWNVAEGTPAPAASDGQPNVGIAAMSLSADGRRLAVSGYDNDLFVTDMASTVWTGEAHENIISELAFSPDASVVVSQEQSLYMDTSAAGDAMALLTSMHWLPADNLVTLWNAETGDELVTLDIEPDRVLRSLAFSPDGTRLAFGTDEGVLVWGVASVLSPNGEAPMTGSSVADAPTNVVANDAWQITVDEVRQETHLQDIFMEDHYPRAGSAFLVVKVTVKNLLFDPANNLPDSNTMVQGVHLYENNAPASGSFALDQVLIRDGSGSEHELAAFSIGSDNLIAPNLTDFTVAAPNEEAHYAFIYDIGDAALAPSLAFVFEDLPAIALGTDEPESAPSATSGQDAAGNVGAQIEAMLAHWQQETSTEGILSVSMPPGWVASEMPHAAGYFLADSQATLDAFASPDPVLRDDQRAILLMPLEPSDDPPSAELITDTPYSALYPDLGLERSSDDAMDTIVISTQADRPLVPLAVGFAPVGAADAEFEMMVVGAFLSLDLHGTDSELLSFYGLENSATVTDDNGSAETSVSQECVVTTSSNINKRGGPGTDFGVVGTLNSGSSATAIGQLQSSDGFTWIQLNDETWVRSDVVTATEGCASLPVVVS